MFSKSTASERAGRARDQVRAAHEVLAGEVAALVSGQDWVRYLDFAARLHAYSPSNVQLIAAQHAMAFAEGRVSDPEPGYVAGFATWKALGRNVTRGQKGYAILAPVTAVQRTATDTEGQIRALARGEITADGEIEGRRQALRGFKVEHVFAACQTTGAELPAPPQPRLLEGEAPPGLRPAVADLIASRGYTVADVATAAAIGGANGRTDWAAKTVVVRADMDDAARVKTLIHEAAHVLLHEQPPGSLLPRPIKEVEAESVAYVVAKVHGMATDGYSFPYVAAWAGPDALRAVTDTQARVAVAARAVIAASPAAHDPGGRVPGADAAVARAYPHPEASRSARIAPALTQGVSL